jgi:iron-sulfur cluster assembly accessory protein
MNKMKKIEKEKQKIVKEMPIGEIFDKFPGKAMKLADVMLGEGLNCVGCGASNFESLEQGVIGHGMDEEKLNEILEKLNDVLNEPDVEGLVLTDVAVEKVKEIIKKEGKEGSYLKIGVVEAGCAGYKYELNFVDEKKDGDEVFECKGIRLIYDKEMKEKLDGVEIDYVEGLQGTGFRFSNPNVSKSCGCGSTFGF